MQGWATPEPRPHAGTATVHELQDAAVISLIGDHDLSTKPELVDRLAKLRNRRRVVIDLQRCTFVDSTIVGAILAACRADAPRGPKVSIVVPDDTSYVYRALSVLGLGDLVPTHPSVASALAVPPPSSA
jgi:anti-anti-sigma factor